MPGCDAGRCRIEFAAGYADYDNDPANGCEVYLNNDAKNCITCEVSCDTSHGDVGCRQGKRHVRLGERREPLVERCRAGSGTRIVVVQLLDGGPGG
jgi:hypothetical protein